MSKIDRMTEEAIIRKDEQKPISIDASQLRLGTYVRYANTREGLEHYGLISELTETRDAEGNPQILRATIQLWMTMLNKQPVLVREETVALSKLKEILGQQELPKVVEEKEPIRLAPNRPGGYKDCDRSGCTKAIYGVISTQAMRQTYKGFKFGDLEPGESLVLVALCAGHYKGRDSYGIVGETWLNYPKLPETPTDAPAKPSPKPVNTLESLKGKSTPTGQEMAEKRISKLRKDGKVDGRSLRWQKMAPEERTAIARRTAKHKR